MLNFASLSSQTHVLSGRINKFIVFSDCEEVDKTCNICDQVLADQLWAKSKEWTDLERRLSAMQSEQFSLSKSKS